MKAQRERIRKVVEKWFLAEPLLFAAWTTHALTIQPRISTIRVRQGHIEYNPTFLDNLSVAELEQVLRFETVRILLKHPYSRQQEDAALTYLASNIALQEGLQTSLPFPYAKDVFGSDEFNHQYLEFYYNKLKELPATSAGDTQGGGAGSGELSGASSSLSSDLMTDPTRKADNESESPSAADLTLGNMDEEITPNLTAYTDAQRSGVENTADWAEDAFLTERLDQAIENAQATQSWGSIAGHLRERILATLKPKLDYRAVLRQFRTSVLSTRRTLTRMKPSRRYGFAYLGSRREFDTQLLFAVDVSGSMGSEDLRQGFSIINRFFQYGIASIDVMHFDSVLHGEPTTFKKVSRAYSVEGRGGTNFAPVLAYIDQHRHYDGLIIFTDGYCPAPSRPQNRRTRILWLFTHESSYRQSYPALQHLGLGAFIKADKRM